MHITQEEISALFECQDCKKTFSGDHSFWDAAIHAEGHMHNITGKTTYFVAITMKGNS
jgi:hypothetical protein